MRKFEIIQYDKREPEHSKLWLQKIGTAYKLLMWNNGWEVIATGLKEEIDLADLKARLEEAEVNITNLQIQVTTNTTNIATNAADIAALVERIKADEESIAANASDIDALEAVTTSGLVASGTYDESSHYIYLYAKDGTQLSAINCADFLIDGMLESATLEVNPDGQDEGTYIHFVFNTDAGKDDVWVNVTSLIDIYTGSDSIDITDNVVSVKEQYILDLLPVNVTYQSEFDNTKGITIGSLNVVGVSTTVVVPTATTEQVGLVTSGDGLTVSEGVMSAVKSENSEDYLVIDETGIAVVGVDAIEARVTQAEADIDSLEGRMDTAEEDIDKLETRMDTAEADIDALEGRMATAEEDIDKLEERMDTAEKDIDSLEDRVSTNETNIAALDTRVSTNETDIGNLEARMSVAETAINNNANNIATNAANISSIFTLLTGLSGTLSTIQATLYSKFGVQMSYDEETYILTLLASDGTELSTVDLSGLISGTTVEEYTTVQLAAGYGITITATLNDDGEVVYTIAAQAFTDSDTITTVASGDDIIEVSASDYDYTISANLERITEDEVETIWNSL